MWGNLIDQKPYNGGSPHSEESLPSFGVVVGHEPAFLLPISASLTQTLLGPLFVWDRGLFYNPAGKYSIPVRTGQPSYLFTHLMHIYAYICSILPMNQL